MEIRIINAAFAAEKTMLVFISNSKDIKEAIITAKKVGDKKGSIGFFENQEIAGDSGEKFWVTAPDKGNAPGGLMGSGEFDNRMAWGTIRTKGDGGL